MLLCLMALAIITNAHAEKTYLTPVQEDTACLLMKAISKKVEGLFTPYKKGSLDYGNHYFTYKTGGSTVRFFVGENSGHDLAIDMTFSSGLKISWTWDESYGVYNMYAYFVHGYDSFDELWRDLRVNLKEVNVATILPTADKI